MSWFEWFDISFSLNKISNLSIMNGKDKWSWNFTHYSANLTLLWPKNLIEFSLNFGYFKSENNNMFISFQKFPKSINIELN